jgi:hypothetical protein
MNLNTTLDQNTRNNDNQIIKQNKRSQNKEENLWSSNVMKITKEIDESYILNKESELLMNHSIFWKRKLNNSGRYL